MKIFFHHPADVQFHFSHYNNGTFPGHLLYGAPHFASHGIDMVLRKHRAYVSGAMKAIDGARQILLCRERYDAVFATFHSGLAIVVMLRALHLFSKPVVVWHHQPVIRSPKWWREMLGRLYYRGMDGIIFFSEKLRDESLKTGKVRPEQTYVCHWGADIEYYDRVIAGNTPPHGTHAPSFISTGKELRDMRTLVAAFNRTGQHLDIYINHNTGDEDYDRLFSSIEVKDNVCVHFIKGSLQDMLSRKVCQASCVVVCCKESNYTVGLTTIVEAIALGKPVICSRNANIPIDIDKERCGITVDYYDIEGWTKAVNYIAAHPVEAAEMGRRGRRLAEELFNDRRCAADIAAVLSSIVTG